MNIPKTHKKWLILILTCCIFTLLPGILFAREDRKVRLNADRVTYNDKTNEMTLLGNVRFTHQDALLSGDRANFNSKIQTGQVRGNVRITQPGTVVTAEKMDVFYSRNLAKLEGGVTFTTTRDPVSAKGKPGEVAQYTKMTTGVLTYDWVARQGVATGGVTVVQGNRRAIGERAYYNGGANIITLEGGVRFEQGSNNWVTAQKVTVDIVNNTYTASGGVAGTFYVEPGPDNLPDPKSLQTERTPDKIPSLTLPFQEVIRPE